MDTLIAGGTALIATMGVIIAFLWRAWKSANTRAETARRLANTTTTVRKLEQEARHAPDDELAKSISRRGPDRDS